MVATHYQSPPTTGTNSLRLPAGYDGGYGFSKLCLEGNEIKIPSYLALLHDSNIYEPERDGACIEYLDGERTDMIGLRWLAGKPAYQEFPGTFLQVVDDKKGKIRYGLHLLLGAIACLPIRASWDLFLIASVQDAQVLGAELSKALSGNHSIRINGKHVSHISISVSAIVEEGLGAIAESTALNLCEGGSQVILIDGGHGTFISSVFAKGKLIQGSRKVLIGGVDALISSVSRNLETRRQLAAEGDKVLIREGIERGDFLYGKSGWCFQDIYNAELKPWVESVLAPALKSVDFWRANSETVLVSGGVARLPVIAGLLAKKGFITIPDSQWANARGLYKLAQIRFRRGA